MFLLPALAVLAACTPTSSAAAAEEVLAIRAARILPVTSAPIHDGVVVVRGGRIAAVGPRAEVAVPPGARVLDFASSWVFPGFIDLHHHVQGGLGDLNDMVHPLNPELRTSDLLSPSSPYYKECLSGGVTTALFIPGSGTNLSGFGTLVKMAVRDGRPVVLREVGAMKVAQAFNPERGSGDLGASRMGMGFQLERLLEQGRAYTESRSFRPDLEPLREVFEGRAPVLVHTAGARDVVATARMFHDKLGLRVILSHGCFDAHEAAPALAERGVPVNLGPRVYHLTREGSFMGTPAAYFEAGVRDLSLNTDAPIVPAEDLFLQGAMSVRLGLPWVEALKALTIHPARQVGVEDRVGSLEPGKDADIVVKAGEPLCPATPVEAVFIDGVQVYRKGDVR